ncbi:NAD(P)-binding protein [Aulographum hederae CBS 113979]|uniref:NAD(P)-binding protein n=1 Tax=Aulographum hederae CBS 113979 TaxID=1176131 RepID=A0A6G1H906_9PEZI|nr:NAD(P)-binding protein [Aulographum hederae CBS 113979]
MAGQTEFPVSQTVRQSPPVDLSQQYDAEWLRGKHIIVTGGASGFGAGFVKKWASHGASVIVADINTDGGSKLVLELRKELDNPNIHFVHCDVTDWQSQVNMFKEATKLSPHGGIDMVVPNAGMSKPDMLQMPKDLDAPEPPPPNFKEVYVDLIGVLYTVHCAIYWLPKNPGSVAADPASNPASNKRDRHILLIGSMASLAPIMMQPLYGASKHGILGLFRSLRASLYMYGIRINLLCPYFVETGIVPTPARLLLAGGGMGRVEDVVEGATRFAADSKICGRSLAVGPKVRVKEDSKGGFEVVPADSPEGEERALWEAYREDLDDSELFMRNFLKLLNSIVRIRGWAGWVKDVIGAFSYGLRSGK